MIGQRSNEIDFSQPVNSGFAIIGMDELALLIPRHQLHALEPTSDVRRVNGESEGWITLAGTRSPVYCLSKDLQPLHEFPAKRRICALLDVAGTPFGILCDHVTMLEQSELEIKPLPACMRMSHIPIHGLLLYRDKVLCLTTAEDLLACLGIELDPASRPASPKLLKGCAL